MIQKILFFVPAVLLIVFLTGCKSDNPENDSPQETDSLEVNDSTENGEQDLDTLQMEDTVEVVYEDPAVQEAHEEIVKKFGTQWDFCTCVQKSDSVNTALMEASDDAFDAIMERSEFIDSKCKGLLIQPNATPEDRAKHEIKVKKCLDAK